MTTEVGLSLYRQDEDQPRETAVCAKKRTAYTTDRGGYVTGSYVGH